jgi:hypothetical protein
MKWTDDVPTVDGWYFWRANKRVTDALHWTVEYVELDIIILGGQWAGPIPEPVE